MRDIFVLNRRDEEHQVTLVGVFNTQAGAKAAAGVHVAAVNVALGWNDPVPTRWQNDGCGEISAHISDQDWYVISESVLDPTLAQIRAVEGV